MSRLSAPANIPYKHTVLSEQIHMPSRHVGQSNGAKTSTVNKSMSSSQQTAYSALCFAAQWAFNRAKTYLRHAQLNQTALQNKRGVEWWQLQL